MQHESAELFLNVLLFLLHGQSDNNWEVDIAHAESLVDENTRAILINNPSNPCGSVFSEQHVRDLVEFARRHGFIVIAVRAAQFAVMNHDELMS